MTADSLRAGARGAGGAGSCGCLHAERAGEAARLRATHGQSRVAGDSPEYRSWRAMIQRCTNPKHEHWEYYGGRGVAICDRWRGSFELFLADMGKRPSKRHTLDRIDVNGNYEPGNCKWSTWEEQAAGRRAPRRRTTAPRPADPALPTVARC